MTAKQEHDMFMMIRLVAVSAAMVGLFSMAESEPVVDGTRNAEDDRAVAVQTVDIGSVDIDGRVDFAGDLLLSLAMPEPCPADLVSSATFQPPPDGIVNGADLAYLLGEWGRNPGSSADIVTSATFAPPPDGLVDGADLAVLLGAWGICPDCSLDPLEPNNDCGQFTTLASVGTDDFRVFSSANLHDEDDVDVFRFIAQETDSSCACCDAFCTDEDYRLTVTLDVPAGAGAPYTFTVVPSACSTTAPATVNPGQSGQIIRFMDGSCPGMDNYTVWVHVYANGPTACENYTLTYHFEMGCF
jgi:hypothetical protein